MKILFFTHYFPPEGNAPASRTYEHCVRWVQAGHDVTVITCVPNVPNGVPYDGFKNRVRAQKEVVDGIHVVRVWTLMAANSGFLKRILNYLTYMLTATWAGLWMKRPDVIVATSPQFFCGWAGVLVQFFRRIPFVLEIRDIWPESIAAVGAMKRGVVIRVLEWLEHRMYASADHIVTVGKGYRDNIAGKVTGTDISVIYNGVDGDQFQPNQNHELFSDLKGHDQFLCVYAGTIGMAHGLEVVLDAAAVLVDRGHSNIRFLMVGDGAQRETLLAQATDTGLETVQFLGRIAKHEMPAAISVADAILVHLRPSDLFETVVPSKIFEAMAMAKPIVMGVRGESAEIVRSAQAGLDMRPGDGESLANCLIQLATDAALYDSFCKSGREFVLSQFNRDVFAQQMLETLQTTVSAQTSGN